MTVMALQGPLGSCACEQGLKMEQNVEHVCSVRETDSWKVKDLTHIRHVILFIHGCANHGEGMRQDPAVCQRLLHVFLYNAVILC